MGFGASASGPAALAKGLNTAVTFDVAVPLETASNAEVWVSGNDEALGKWNGAGVKLSRGPDGRYTGSVSLPVDTSVEFKVTRGSWETVEKARDGKEIPNRTFKVGTKKQTVAITVFRWADQSAPPTMRTLVGNIRYLRQVPSRFLPKKRDVIVWLPPDYEDSPRKRYPVLYMHDGQNLMDKATAYSGEEWRVDEAAQQAIQAGDVEPLIIVGIYNTEDRFAEYTPVKDPGEFSKYGGGNADAYGRFIVEELKPAIDRTFRTKQDPESTGLGGSSLGGLVTMYLGVKYPHVFRRLAVVSPSVFWANKDIVTRVKALKKKQPLKIWMDIGTDESKGSQETVEDTRQLRDALVEEGWVLGKDLKYVEVAGAVHSEAAWSERIDEVLRYLYPTPWYKPPPSP
ncbi:putative alpha-dextrin endo-1, 6-alpha-glucosidase [Hyalangium minutum]|uniref:Putative alpha-dextrin endo-1, 6-alpha-glucosidase n=1 Tax=Hyalangium minutum TaxID=394096 RepID=A0A085WWR7_9BACT|nr:putative alpha-dextrin endo-1, 6-alpha-glucosidase [Hyalangium minutum]